MHSYEPLLSATRPETSLGCTTIYVYRPSELGARQTGYSISPTGASLVGNKDGDWRRSWLVIGSDDTSGDPIFIDTSEESYPVYTAMHGSGYWDPLPIAVSLAAFAHALSAVAAIAEDRKSPVALAQHPLTQSERDTTLAIIRQHNPKLDLSFWEILLTDL
jgi:hypothetical protein